MEIEAAGHSIIYIVDGGGSFFTFYHLYCLLEEPCKTPQVLSSQVDLD